MEAVGLFASTHPHKIPYYYPNIE